jgi:hypothetical protein
MHGVTLMATASVTAVADLLEQIKTVLHREATSPAAG